MSKKKAAAALGDGAFLADEIGKMGKISGFHQQQFGICPLKTNHLTAKKVPAAAGIKLFCTQHAPKNFGHKTRKPE